MEAVIVQQPVKNLLARGRGTRSWLARKWQGNLGRCHGRSLGSNNNMSSRKLWTRLDSNQRQQMFAVEQCRFAPLNVGVRWHVVRAFSNNSDSRGNEDAEGWESAFEIEVPSDQRPVNELAALKEGALYSWAQLSPAEFAARLGGLWLLIFLLLGGPIAAGSFEPTHEPLKFVLAGGAGSLFAVAVLLLRMYLGWSYVGDRLLSAVVPYEETGWYDGQLYVKPPEILARDRLLGAYQVKPVMNRLKQTLIGAGALLATATAALVVLSPVQESPDLLMFPSPRKLDLLNPPVAVMDDDELAAAAAAAANGRPVYCADRYYRALAGGQYCKWEDLRK